MNTNDHVTALFIGAMFHWFMGDEKASFVFLSAAVEISHMSCGGDA